MKKGKKILLIFGGIFAIFGCLGMLAVAALIVIEALIAIGMTIFYTVMTVNVVNNIGDGTAIINGHTYTADSDITPIIMNGVMYSGIELVIFSFLTFIALIGFVLCLLSAIFAFIGASKKGKKGTHIASIIFSSLSLLPAVTFAPVAFIYALIFIILFFIILLLFLLPIGWIGLIFIAASFGTMLSFLLILVGNILGLLALKKEKNEAGKDSNEPLLIEQKQ